MKFNINQRTFRLIFVIILIQFITSCSKNNSNRFTNLNLKARSVSAIALTKNDNLYVGTEHGLWEYITDSGKWGQLGNAKINNMNISSINIDKNNNIYVSAEHGEIWEYTNNKWVKLSLSYDDVLSQVSTDKNNNIYLATDNYIWQYLNNRKLWIKIVNKAPEDDSATITKIDLNGNIYAGTSHLEFPHMGHVWKYNIKKKSWVGLNLESKDDQYIDSMAIDQNNNLYAATSNGNVWKYQINILTWEQIGSTLPESNSMLISMAIDKNNNIYGVAYSGNIWKYAIEDNSWSQISSITNNQESATLIVGDIIIDSKNNLYVEVNSGTIEAGTYKGTIWKYDAKQSWFDIFYRHKIANISTPD